MFRQLSYQGVCDNFLRHPWLAFPVLHRNFRFNLIIVQFYFVFMIWRILSNSDCLDESQRISVISLRIVLIQVNLNCSVILSVVFLSDFWFCWELRCFKKAIKVRQKFITIKVFFNIYLYLHSACIIKDSIAFLSL